MLTVQIRNPSDYDRPEKDRQECEYVAIPWPRVAAADPTLTRATVGARTADGSPLACDVVRRGAADEELLIRVDDPLPGRPAGEERAAVEVHLGDWGWEGGEDGATLEFDVEGAAEPLPAPRRASAAPELLASVVRVRLVNEGLNVWFDLRDHFGKEWFAGAASSVRLSSLELLDNYEVPPDRHDPEKRCMQIDRVVVSRPGWERPPLVEYELFASPYTLVDYARGPVGASITIASPVLAYGYRDPFGGGERELACRLYRRLSLYGGATYVAEEAWLRGEAPDAEAPVDLYFTARYFSYMVMGVPPRVTALAGIEGWRAIMRYEPRQGYGFATDAPTGAVLNPHPGYPNVDRADRTFSWEVGVCAGYRCVHLFDRSPPDRLEHNTGRTWYELMFQPFEVEIVPSQPASDGAAAPRDA